MADRFDKSPCPARIQRADSEQHVSIGSRQRAALEDHSSTTRPFLNRTFPEVVLRLTTQSRIF